jgi:hypothetical protein
LHGEEIVATTNQGLYNKKSTITHIHIEVLIDLDKLQYNNNRCRMSVYGSDNVAVLGNNTNVIVLYGSIQSSHSSKPVLGVIISESPQCPQSNLEGTQSVAWFLPEKKVAWPSKVRQPTNKS